MTTAASAGDNVPSAQAAKIAEEPRSTGLGISSCRSSRRLGLGDLMDATASGPQTLAENTARKQRGRQFERGVSGNPGGRPKGSRNNPLAVPPLVALSGNQSGSEPVSIFEYAPCAERGATRQGKRTVASVPIIPLSWAIIPARIFRRRRPSQRDHGSDEHCANTLCLSSRVIFQAMSRTSS
jgi:hypothetical protein